MKIFNVVALNQYANLAPKGIRSDKCTLFIAWKIPFLLNCLIVSLCKREAYLCIPPKKISLAAHISVLYLPTSGPFMQTWSHLSFQHVF